MNDSRLLYEAFGIYYENGIKALNENKLDIAKRQLLSAAEALLKLAKVSPTALKNERIRRAEEIYALAEKIDKKIKCGGDSSSDSANQGDEQSENEGGTRFEPVKSTGVSLNDVVGLDDVKDTISRIVIEPLKHPGVYRQFKKKSGGGILLYGLPGTGKTMVAKAIADELKVPFFSIKCSDIVSKWFGAAEKNIKSLFGEAKKYPCSVIFFDEFESIGAKRDTGSTVMKRIVPELLAQMQGFEKSDSTVLVLAATNRPWDIDSAFLRPGRFNSKIYVPLPDVEARMAIVRNNLDGVPGAESLDIGRIASVTDGFNCADVVEFCEHLKEKAIGRTISKGVTCPVLQEDVSAVAGTVKSSVCREDLKKMLEYKNT